MSDPTIVVEFQKPMAPYTIGEKAGFPREAAERMAEKGIAKVIGPAKPSPLRVDRQSVPGTKGHQTREL